MPIPTSYTEEGLASFLFNDPQMRPVWDAIGVTEESADTDLAEIVVEALLSHGVEAIADVSGAAAIQKLRTLARYHAWETIAGNFVIDVNYSADGESFSRDQLFKHAQAMLTLWEGKAAQYLSRYKVTKQVMTQDNPYTPTPLSERFKLVRWE